MTTKKRTTTNRDASAIPETLRITKIKPRKGCGGSWVVGTIAGHRFEALVFPEHAENKALELGDSRISKLWVRRIDDNVTVVNFDRGWDVLPATPRANAIVDVLAARLAEQIFGRWRPAERRPTMASEFQGAVQDEVHADLGLNDTNERVIRLDLDYTRCGPRPFETRIVLSIDAAISLRNQLDELLVAGPIKIVDSDELVDREDRCPNCGNRQIDALTPIDSAVAGEVQCDRCEQVYRIENTTRRDRRAQRQLLGAATTTLRLWNKHGLGDSDAESEPVHQSLVDALARAKGLI